MAEDIHKFKKRLESARENIQNSDKIDPENKKLAKEFDDWLALNDKSYSRHYRYMQSLKMVIEHNNFSLRNLQEDEESKRKISRIIRQVKESAYYSGEYSQKTKKEYHGFIKRLLEFHDLSSDPERSSLLPDDFTAYVAEKDKNKTDPDDLPTPEDVKKIARKLQARSYSYHSVLQYGLRIT